MNYALKTLQREWYELKSKLNRLQESVQTPAVENDTRITEQRIKSLEKALQVISKEMAN